MELFTKIANKSEEDAEAYALRRRKAMRRALLEKLIKQIENGEYSNLRSKIQNLAPSRQEYKSPLDRSSYNYGYMESKEMEAGTPNIW